MDMPIDSDISPCLGKFHVHVMYSPCSKLPFLVGSIQSGN